MNHTVFHNEFLLAVRSKAIILTIIIAGALVIYGQLSTYHSVAQCISQNDSFVQSHSAGINGEIADNSQIEKSTVDAYQILQPAYAVNNTQALLATLLPVFFVVIASIIIGQEFSSRTAPIKAAYWGWPRVIGMKDLLLLVLIVLTFAVMTCIGAVTGLLNWQRITPVVQAHGSKMATVPPYSVFKQFAVVFLLTSVYCLLAAFVTLLTRKTFAGCLIPLLLMYFVEGQIPCPYLPAKLGAVLIQKSFLFSSFSFFMPNQASAGTAETTCFILLFLYSVLLFAACWAYACKQTIRQR